MRFRRSNPVFLVLAVALGVVAAVSPIALGVSQVVMPCICCPGTDDETSHAAMLHEMAAAGHCEHPVAPAIGETPADTGATSDHAGCSDCSGCLLLGSAGVSGVLTPESAAIAEQSCGYIFCDIARRSARGFLTPPQRPPSLR